MATVVMAGTPATLRAVAVRAAVSVIACPMRTHPRVRAGGGGGTAHARLVALLTVLEGAGSASEATHEALADMLVPRPPEVPEGAGDSSCIGGCDSEPFTGALLRALPRLQVRAGRVRSRPCVCGRGPVD